MANTKKKKKKDYDEDFKKEIIGIVFITIGIFLFINVITSSLGILGQALNKITWSLLGIGTYFLPMIFVFYGISILLRKDTMDRRFIGISVFLFNSILFLQMIYIDNYYVDSFYEGIKVIINTSSKLHGGILGYIIDVPLYKLIGKTGSIILFVAIYVITMIIIFNFSLYNIANNLKNQSKSKEKTKSNKTNNRQKEQLNVALDETSLESTKEREEFIKGINNKIKILDFMKNSSIDVEEEIPIDTYEAATSSSKLEKDVKESISEEISSKIEGNQKNIQYEFPGLDLLNINTNLKLNKDDKKDLLTSASKLEETLNSFGVEAKIIQVTKGPSVTRYELQPSAGVKVSKIVNLSDDIALSLAASGVRIEAPIPGKSAVGIEVPNKDITAVFLKEVVESEEFENNTKNLAFSLGKDIGGNCVVADLTKMPHLLIAGATGSGKSVCINTLIISLLYKYSPDEVKLLMVDPKMVELNVYNGIPHLLIPVVTDPKKAAAALNWAVNEMTRRYKLFADCGVRNIESYNELFYKEKITEKLPWIVIIVDELADLMMVCPHDVEDYIGRLSQMARAAGMHLVIATQRPSVDVITGVIKANIPSRISFSVSSQVDSRTILDSAGAEKLLGKGDMLFYPVGESKPLRIQGAFISEEEVERVVTFIKEQQLNKEDYEEKILEHINEEIKSEDPGSEEDELLEEAIRIVVEANQASTSLLQRRLRIGYNRAARIMEQLEEKRVISPRDGSKPREVLLSKEDI
ncbi:FtsK/SpoIIIE family DNA translocase [Clostridium amazonitimonense]|uniref:FtsK/SpoIIIE family DNA translocase n=1 Tax=Clostridium amazonitimonense TaxID=1499689 RepID=UPI0005099F13|nr:DNA translocase FtsK [Clostridium amazonitimonense]